MGPGQAGYVCPYLRCPKCRGDLLWEDAARRQASETLRCRRTDCDGVIGPGEVVLTRRRMLTDPPDVLFTTTEMLNQRLGDSRFGRLFGVLAPADQKPPLVLLDEAHTYAGTTGAQVALLLRRWQHAARSRPHFVGLSATLQDARRFFATLTGLPELAVEEVAPAGPSWSAKGPSTCSHFAATPCPVDRSSPLRSRQRCSCVASSIPRPAGRPAGCTAPGRSCSPTISTSRIGCSSTSATPRGRTASVTSTRRTPAGRWRTSGHRPALTRPPGSPLARTGSCAAASGGGCSRTS